MEAASALTALNDEELKRYIPEHKKPDAALTFPEKVSNLMLGRCNEALELLDRQDGVLMVISWNKKSNERK